MDLKLSPEQETLRVKARAWLAAEHPGPTPLDLDARFQLLRDWQRKLYEAGWIGLAWPQEFGGRGGSPLDQVIFNQELARAKAPPPIGIIGLEVVGPSIREFGTDDQRKRFVPPLLSGEEIWCQGFSEPNAGSDLASLSTRARREGDEFVVSGQKVWTSWAQYAKWCAVLVRTDPDAPKHRGISYLIVDMHSPGVTVRPLIQMTGEAEFNEVFFDEVRVPSSNLIGGLNEGWHVALHTLSFERGPFTLKRQVEFRVALDELVGQLQGVVIDGTPALEQPLVRQRLGEVEVLVEAMAAQGYSTVSRIIAGTPGPESSVEKLFLAEVEQRLFGLALDLLGPYRMVEESYGGLERARWIRDYFYSRAVSIYGGTSEIQRTIVAERLLGLPRG